MFNQILCLILVILLTYRETDFCKRFSVNNPSFSGETSHPAPLSLGLDLEYLAFGFDIVIK